MSDSKKTKKELLAEIEALRARLGDEAPAPTVGAVDGVREGMTRREILASAWVAPIILTVPLGASLAVSPQRANAQTGAPTTAPAPTSSPTPAATPQPPTNAPVMPPTSAPSSVPTAFPTATTRSVIPVEISEFDIR